MLGVRNACCASQPVRMFFKEFFKRKPKSTSTPVENTVNKSFGNYDIIVPGMVSERKEVPSYIPKPSYSQSSIPEERFGKPEIKNQNQIESMRHSCILAKQVLSQISRHIKPGVTTDELDEKIFQMIISNGAYPSPLNYRGFPKSVCTSINNVACHGIPDDRPLQEGDSLNIDVTVYLNGYHGDCSEMFKIGKVDEEAEKLISATKTCLMSAIEICKPNEKFCSIGKLIEETAAQHGYNIIPAFAGHGIGSYFHGPPDIFHFANEYPGEMQAGMTFTIEPVLTQGGQEIEILEDGWTAVTVDHARTAQVEHTILITDTGCDILTY